MDTGFRDTGLWAIVVAFIYFGTFIALGWALKRGLDRWMARRGAHLDEMQRQTDEASHETLARQPGLWRR